MAYKSYVKKGYNRGDITRNMLEAEDYSLTGYGGALDSFRSQLLEDNLSESMKEALLAKTYKILVDGQEVLNDYTPKIQEDTLLFPAMAITRAGKNVSFDGWEEKEEMGVFPPGYTSIEDAWGTKAYVMNGVMYVPKYGILRRNHETWDSCYRLKTQPIVEDEEVYVDLDTLQIITYMDYDLDEEEGVLNLYLNEENIESISMDHSEDWIEIDSPSAEEEMNMSGDEYFQYILDRIAENG